MKVTCPNCDKSFKLPKKTRAPNSYNLFVRQQMATAAVKALPPSERMQACAAAWARHKSKVDQINANRAQAQVV